VGLSLWLAACGTDEQTSSPSDVHADAGTDAPGDSTPAEDALAETNSSADAPSDTPSQGEGGPAEDVGEASSEASSDAPVQNDVAEADVTLVELSETEPNDGATLEEYNELPLDADMRGSIGTVGDADIFRVQAEAGKVVRVVVWLPPGSALEPHLVVFDDGRGNKAPGDDYVKVAVGKPATLEFLAMDSGGYYVAVRDVRNLSSPAVGGVDFTYSLQATEHATSAFEGQPLVFPSQFTDSLGSPSGLRLYAFTGSKGADIVVDLKAKGDMDGRLMIYADAISSWIARNDDRGAQDKNPLIDAFLTEGGPMFLVVENIHEKANNLSYTLDVP